MVANYLNPLSINDYTCHGYVLVILGACAMSLGCKSRKTAPGYRMLYETFWKMLCDIYQTARLMVGHHAMSRPNRY